MNPHIDSKAPYQIHRGPYGITLILDASEIINTAPGKGIPARVELGHASASLRSCIESAKCDEEQLSVADLAWLCSIVLEVGAWMKYQTPLAHGVMLNDTIPNLRERLVQALNNGDKDLALACSIAIGKKSGMHK